MSDNYNYWYSPCSFNMRKGTPWKQVVVRVVIIRVVGTKILKSNGESETTESGQKEGSSLRNEASGPQLNNWIICLFLLTSSRASVLQIIGSVCKSTSSTCEDIATLQFYANPRDAGLRLASENECVSVKACVGI